MRKRWNGSVQSNNTPTWDKVGIRKEDYGFYRCLVTEVLFVDDPQNISKNAPNAEVLYTVAILGGAASGQTLSYCRLASYLSYGERTLKATTKDISKDDLTEHDGDIVYIQFIQGHDAYPVITGIAKSFQNNTGAKKEDGPRLLELFNGFTTSINNKGEYARTMNGGTAQDNNFKANDDAIIKEEWSSEETLTRTYKSGLIVKEDGKNDKIAMTTSGGAVVSVDGKGMMISIKAGSAEVLIDGNSGKISLKSDMVDLGSSPSDFVTMFTQLATAWSTHQHITTAPGSPTSPPLAPLLSTVGSQTVKVQS